MWCNGCCYWCRLFAIRQFAFTVFTADVIALFAITTITVTATATATTTWFAFFGRAFDLIANDLSGFSTFDCAGGNTGC